MWSARFDVDDEKTEAHFLPFVFLPRLLASRSVRADSESSLLKSNSANANYWLQKNWFYIALAPSMPSSQPFVTESKLANLRVARKGSTFRIYIVSPPSISSPRFHLFIAHNPINGWELYSITSTHTYNRKEYHTIPWYPCRLLAHEAMTYRLTHGSSFTLKANTSRMPWCQTLWNPSPQGLQEERMHIQRALMNDERATSYLAFSSDCIFATCRVTGRYDSSMKTRSEQDTFSLTQVNRYRVLHVRTLASLPLSTPTIDWGAGMKKPLVSTYIDQCEVGDVPPHTFRH